MEGKISNKKMLFICVVLAVVTFLLINVGMCVSAHASTENESASNGGWKCFEVPFEEIEINTDGLYDKYMRELEHYWETAENDKSYMWDGDNGVSNVRLYITYENSHPGIGVHCRSHCPGWDNDVNYKFTVLALSQNNIPQADCVVEGEQYYNNEECCASISQSTHICKDAKVDGDKYGLSDEKACEIFGHPLEYGGKFVITYVEVDN